MTRHLKCSETFYRCNGDRARSLANPQFIQSPQPLLSPHELRKLCKFNSNFRVVLLWTSLISRLEPRTRTDKPTMFVRARIVLIRAPNGRILFLLSRERFEKGRRREKNRPAVTPTKGAQIVPYSRILRRLVCRED